MSTAGLVCTSRPRTACAVPTIDSASAAAVARRIASPFFAAQSMISSRNQYVALMRSSKLAYEYVSDRMPIRLRMPK